jgi:hypothetical protein
MRLKPDTTLPPQNDLSRDDLVDDLTLQLREVFDSIPSNTENTDQGLPNGHAVPPVVPTRKFVIEAHQVGPCNAEMQNAIKPSVFKVMKVILGVFGMAPASINITEQ